MCYIFLTDWFGNGLEQTCQQRRNNASQNKCHLSFCMLSSWLCVCVHLQKKKALRKIKWIHFSRSLKIIFSTDVPCSFGLDSFLEIGPSSLLEAKKGLNFHPSDQINLRGGKKHIFKGFLLLLTMSIFVNPVPFQQVAILLLTSRGKQQGKPPLLSEAL